MPRVSVIIPSYNHAPYIGKAIQSVLDQTEKDLELIIIDDGSKDDSLEVIRRFTDPRIKVFPQPNCGAHAAINRGLSLAASPYLAILNSDDQYTPGRLQQLVSILDSNPRIGLCGSYIEVVDEKDTVLGVKHGYRDLEPWALPQPEKSFRAGEDLRAVLLTENYWSTTSNYVFSKAWYEKVGEFQPLRYAHDWDFALRISRQADLYLHPEPLMKYRVHASNTIRENQAAMVFEICWILAVHLPGQITTDWFNAQPGSERVTQLLNSTYVYGMDRVLAIMLAQQLSERPDLALQLLDPQNPIRAAYLDYIIGEQQALNPPPQQVPANASFIRRVIRYGKRQLRKIASRL